jgi:hypothetical protein
MAINFETIWNDTYQTRTIWAGEKTEVTIATAIYSSERIVSDLTISIRDKFNTARAQADMSAETMELLAAHRLETNALEAA